MAQATGWLRHCFLLSPSPSHSLYLARRRCSLPFSLLLKRKANPSISANLCSSSLPSTSFVASNDTSDSTVFYLYNTLTKRKEPFRPKVEGKVGMYVCGITAYDLSHIGHARVSVVFDVLYRYLKHLKYEVIYVRNFTDVDDKIISRANELGEDPLTLSSRYCAEFQSDMAHLHCMRPTVEPRVSTHMNQIIDMIKQILVNGFAYSIDGDVYFSVDKCPSYGQLSGRKLEDNQPGQRVAVDSRKQNPADFALWKASKSGEPFWESPWGPGRPGWHIECSSMSATYLGYSFDIHGGGMDLVFPHHENEIAQSCAACKESNVSYWVHNGFVDIGSEKMSKSLGNFVTIRQVIDMYHPLALRLFLIGTHYRSTISYSIAQLEVASDRLYYIYQTICDCDNSLNEFNVVNLKDYVPKYIVDCINKFRFDFEKSLADDLHTSIALASFSDVLKIINDLLHTHKGKREHLRMESLVFLGNEIKDGLHILGLKPSSFTQASNSLLLENGNILFFLYQHTSFNIQALLQLKEKALKRAGLSEEQVLQKIEARSSARKAKLYEKSDVIRTELAAAGITLMDGPDETTWRPAVPLHLQEQLPSSA